LANHGPSLAGPPARVTFLFTRARLYRSGTFAPARRTTAILRRSMANPKDKAAGDLSVTALYTAETWAWGGLSSAELFSSEDSKRVFGATNAALGVASLFRKDPSLRHGLIQRHALIDRLLRDAGARRVIELAAGLSRRGAAVSADASIDYTEVDLPLVLAKKRALLERSEAGRAVLARPNIHLVPGDVAELDLGSLAPPGEPLFVIAEGLFMYLEPDAQKQLWSRVHALLVRAGGGRFVFDLVPTGEKAPPGAVGRTLEGLMKRFTGGRSFEQTARTRADITSELGALGFERIEALDPSTVAATYELPFADVPTQQLVFSAAVAP
jgi:O-methyltransferase involved in polyketide biosynthesis